MGRLPELRVQSLFLGDPGTFKSSMVDVLTGEIGRVRGEDVVVLGGRGDKRDFGFWEHGVTSNKRMRNWSSGYVYRKVRKAKGGALVFEDFDKAARNFPEIKDVVRDEVERPRCAVFAIGHHVKGGLWRVANQFQFVVLTPLTDTTNFEKLFGSRAAARKVKERLSTLEKGEAFLVDMRKVVICLFS